MLRKSLLPLFGLALALIGCAPSGSTRAGRSGEVAWAISRSPDGAVEVAHPANWRLQDSGPGKLGLTSPDGCRFDLVLSIRPEPEGLTQAEVLDGMDAAAELSCFRNGLEFESAGRRVWLGDELIWYEVHYRGTPTPTCDKCSPRYTVEMAAFPAGRGRVAASFICPGLDPPGAEREQLLLDILNTLVLFRVGSV